MNKRIFFIALVVFFSCLEQVSGQQVEEKFINPKDVQLLSIKYNEKTETRNPFQATALPPKPLQDISKVPPLERYELDKYKLTATVQDYEGKYKGNLVDPNNKGYLVTVGDKVGNNGGKVISVDDNKVVVQEQDIDVNRVEKTITHEFLLKKNNTND
ncbi:MAG: pilus assembly protein PilP [Deltaproteobacteria bacterium]|jgi:Tfp pilus assembly protein PilP|nr:pilus assembly protein PilP [Deltaproteobacteria bacterium]